jgi:hypothetical protein
MTRKDHLELGPLAVTDLARIQGTELKTKPGNNEDKIREGQPRILEMKAHETKLKRLRSESKSWIRMTERRM